jgi:NAD(P)-dependent dehydrogenase (short-subunit alcohol dehydrogenase family)
MQSFHRKAAFVTGRANGIGFALGRAFAKRTAGVTPCVACHLSHAPTGFSATWLLSDGDGTGAAMAINSIACEFLVL